MPGYHRIFLLQFACISATDLRSISAAKLFLLPHQSHGLAKTSSSYPYAADQLSHLRLSGKKNRSLEHSVQSPAGPSCAPLEGNGTAPPGRSQIDRLISVLFSWGYYQGWKVLPFPSRICNSRLADMFSYLKSSTNK